MRCDLNELTKKCMRELQQDKNKRKEVDETEKGKKKYKSRW